MLAHSGAGRFWTYDFDACFINFDSKIGRTRKGKKHAGSPTPILVQLIGMDAAK